MTRILSAAINLLPALPMSNASLQWTSMPNFSIFANIPSQISHKIDILVAMPSCGSRGPHIGDVYTLVWSCSTQWLDCLLNIPWTANQWRTVLRMTIRQPRHRQYDVPCISVDISYACVVRFILLVLHLQLNDHMLFQKFLLVTCMNKPMMKCQQKLDWKTDLPWCSYSYRKCMFVDSLT